MFLVLLEEFKEWEHSLLVKPVAHVTLSVFPEDSHSVARSFTPFGHESFAFLGFLESLHKRLSLPQLLFEMHDLAALHVHIVRDAEAVVAIVIVE